MTRVRAQARKGGFRYTEYGPLIQSDPGRASDQLRGELARHDFNQVKTAKAMGVPARTLVRWLAKVAGLGFPAVTADDRPGEGLKKIA